MNKIKLGTKDRRAGGYFISAYIEELNKQNHILTAWVDKHLNDINISRIELKSDLNDVKQSIDLIIQDSQSCTESDNLRRLITAAEKAHDVLYRYVDSDSDYTPSTNEFDSAEDELRKALGLFNVKTSR